MCYWGVRKSEKSVGRGVGVWGEVRGEVWGVYGVSVKSVGKDVRKCVGVWGRQGKMWGVYGGKCEGCGKVCWGVRGGVGKCVGV